MTTKEFEEQIEKGNAQILTVEKANQLKGKKIYWFYFGYSANENTVEEMTVGDIVSKWDFYKNEPMEGYSSRTAYWESYFNERQLRETKGTLMLLDQNGNNKFINCFTTENYFDELTFTCSDADRPVFFIEA